MSTFVAGRDEKGHIRLDSGNGLIVAYARDTRADIEKWLTQPLPEFHPMYRAALALMDREQQAVPVKYPVIDLVVDDALDAFLRALERSIDRISAPVQNAQQMIDGTPADTLQDVSELVLASLTRRCGADFADAWKQYCDDAEDEL